MLLIGAIVAITWLRLAPTVEDAGWIGWDAYPILLASQIETPSDVVDVATRRLAGEYLNASFYRPLFMLTVSAEQAVFDASPKTSMTLQVGLFGLCLTALWWWIGSWRREGEEDEDEPNLGRAVALVLVSMHPMVFDVVPYLPRRADLLCVLFVLLTLRLDRIWVESGRRVVLAASLVCAVLAMASKETALLLPLLIVSARGLFASDPWAFLSERRRWIRPLAAYSLVIGLVLLPRLAVLGGVGGYPDADRSFPFSPKLVAVTLVQLVLPDSGLQQQGSGVVAVTILLLGFGALGGLVPFRRAVVRHRLVLFSAFWTLAAAILYAVVGRVSPWYLLFVGFGAFAGAGELTRSALRALARQEWSWWAWNLQWLAGLPLLLYLWWPGSLVAGSTDELRDAGVAVASCLEQTARRCGRGDRQPVGFRGCRERVEGHGRSVAALKPRSVAAWAEWSGIDCAVAVPSPSGKLR